MLTFSGKTSKADVLAGLARHREADEIIQDSDYWWDGHGGGAVGCVLHDIAPGEEGEHYLWESLLGIPEDVALLVDDIFEALPNAEAETWPERFIQAVPEGADLGDVVKLFDRRLQENGCPSVLTDSGALAADYDCTLDRARLGPEGLATSGELATWLIEAVAEAARVLA